MAGYLPREKIKEPPHQLEFRTKSNRNQSTEIKDSTIQCISCGEQ